MIIVNLLDNYNLIDSLMRKIINLIIILLSISSYSQIDSLYLKQSALIHGQKMINSFDDGDYDTFIKLNHPKIIELMGGEEKMKNTLKKGLGENIEIIETTITNPQKVIVYKDMVQCVIEQEQIMNVEGKKLYTKGSLIAISYDLGKSWIFIGVASNTLSSLKIHFPELSNDLKIKPQTKPILIN